MDTGTAPPSLPPAPHQDSLPPPQRGDGPIPLMQKDLPAAAMVHVRPDSMPAPVINNAPQQQTPAEPITFTPPVVAPPPPAPVAISNPQPVAPPPPKPFVPVPAHVPPPIITPAVFESKSSRKQNKKSHGIGSWIAVTFLVFFVIVTILYFWGAHLANQ